MAPAPDDADDFSFEPTKEPPLDYRKSRQQEKNKVTRWMVFWALFAVTLGIALVVFLVKEVLYIQDVKVQSHSIYINVGGDKPEKDPTDPAVVWQPDYQFLDSETQRKRSTRVRVNKQECPSHFANETKDSISIGYDKDVAELYTKLFCTSREFEDSAHYVIPAADGPNTTVTVILHFIEISDEPTEDVFFYVRIQGEVIKKFNIYQESRQALYHPVRIRVGNVHVHEDGMINIELLHAKPKLNAIEIHPREEADTNDALTKDKEV